MSERMTRLDRKGLSMASSLDYAFMMAANGFRAFPLKPLSAAPSADGAIERATTDLEVIREWWSASPLANLGIATGGAGGLIAVELTGKAAISWWASSGFGMGAVVRPPSPTTEIHVFASEALMATFSPRSGVTVKGEGDWVIAPGSILPTGTVRGDLSAIPSAPFTGERDFADGGQTRLLPFLDVGNRMPELTSASTSFLELTMRRPQDGAPAHARAIRRRIMREALLACMSRRDAASLAFGSAAGLQLREGGDAGCIWTELDEVERSDEIGPSPVTLLESGERDVAEAAWWGTRFVAAASGSSTCRIDLWRLLSDALGADLLVQTPSGLVPATLDPFLLTEGDLEVTRGDTSVLRDLQTALGIAERPAAASAAEGPVADASGWTTTELAARVWVVSEPASVDSSDASPWPLATELGDARDRLLTTAGLPPYSVRTSDEAATRHARFRSGLPEFLDDDAAAEFELLVRKAAALVAASEGSEVVDVRHELIALKECEGWFGNLVWVIDRIDAH